MDKMTIKDLLDASKGIFYGDEALLGEEVKSLVTDSRKAGKNGAYGAIKGERVDGHDFIKAAANAGVILIFGEKNGDQVMTELKEANLAETTSYIEVSNTVTALGRMASRYMDILKIPVVAVTGSVGKTSTKETIAAVLSEKFKVGKTLGNHNNEIGLPLTCFEMDKNTQIAVLEMGISAPMEMDYLTSIVSPDVAVVTNIGVSHLENLGSREGIFEEKIKICSNLPNNGLAVLCGDDALLSKVDKLGDIAPLFYGFNIADKKNMTGIYAKDIKQDGLNGTDFKLASLGLDLGLDNLSLHIKVPGQHMILNAMAAALVAWHFGIESDKIAQGLAKLETISGRTKIIDTGRITIIDDAYNASPVSMETAIDTLKLAKGRKIAVLGSMFELGKGEREMHYDIGAYAALNEVDILLTVGDLAKEYNKAFAYKKAEKNEKIEANLSYETNGDLIEGLKTLLKDGDSILVKASNSMNFAQVVEALKEYN